MNNTNENNENNENEYDILYSTFKNYTMPELLNLCEKHKLSIYGNREMIMDRLSYYFSEGRRKNSFQYRMKDCCNKIVLRFNNYYIQI